MRIGIIGAGQLGQMLGFAARKLGIECVFLDPAEAPPAAVCGTHIRRPFDDAESLTELAATCDVITYEFENVPVEAIEKIEHEVTICPPAAALRHSQDRVDEKRLFDRLDIPLAGYRVIDTRDDITAAIDALGLPLVVKTRRLGYDGKGQFILRSRDDVDAAWRALGARSLVAEQWVRFDYEVSIIGVRNARGEVRHYPLARNVHEGGILHTSCAPIDAPGLADRAASYAHRLLGDLDYVGVMALELFVCGDDLLANELAPRVHNSGHWSIEGSVTSQFENHLRAVLGFPLGSTDGIGHSGMVNLIGEIPDVARGLDFAHLHDYGKTPRPGRKLGHLTVTAGSAAERDDMIRRICDTIGAKSR